MRPRESIHDLQFDQHTPFDHEMRQVSEAK
jgi:hypothetical protein